MHNMKLYPTRYGVMQCCEWCKVTPLELQSMNSEELKELESLCEKNRKEQEENFYGLHS